MIYKTHIIAYLLFSILFIGCSDKVSKSNTMSEDVSYLHTLMHSVYFWNDTLKTYSDIELTQFETTQDLLDDMRYSLDKWSAIQTYEDYNNSANQIDSGFGCIYKRDDDKLYILETEFDSPCDNAGIQRGDLVISINAILGPDLTNEEYTTMQENVGVESVFIVERNSTLNTFNVAPIEYSYKTVKHQILEQNSTKIGHIIYESFTSTSSSEIEEAFTSFKDNNVTELIIDLRYNGGGSLAVASILLDKIGGSITEDSLQYTLQYNPNNTQYNESGYFSQDANSLNLSRVLFLTTDGSASASELVINALKPYLDVVQIGKTTHGKPVGMNGYERDNIIYWPITFETVNANGIGGYFDGIDPTCTSEDNIQYLRTDENGDMLKEALYYIKNGGCS